MKTVPNEAFEEELVAKLQSLFEYEVNEALLRMKKNAAEYKRTMERLHHAYNTRERELRMLDGPDYRRCVGPLEDLAIRHFQIMLTSQGLGYLEHGIGQDHWYTVTFYYA